MAIDRCVCYRLPFAELQRLAGEVGADYARLSELTKCGTGCGLCVPYLKLMLLTGNTSFPVLSPARLQKMVREASSKCGASNAH